MSRMASEGDGKKRRSFLPAPKKVSGLQCHQQQVPFSGDNIHSLSTALPLSSTVYSTEASPISTFSATSSASRVVMDQTRVQPSRSHRPDKTRADRQSEERGFGSRLFVGARVKIGGIKSGFLRYLGPTHIAPGLFCGIELLDADGNHDGEVNGYRYFTCAPNHGIFAPKDKVCLDTSSDLQRITADSDLYYYGSNDSLDERKRNVFSSYDLGKHEPVHCPKLSQSLIAHGGQFIEDINYEELSRELKLLGKTGLQPPRGIGAGRSSESLESQDFSDTSNKTPRSSLPRATKASPLAAPVQSKLPSFSHNYNKLSEDSLFYQRPLSHSSQRGAPMTSSVEAIARNQRSDFDSDQENDRLSRDPRKHRAICPGEEERWYEREALSTGNKKQFCTDSNRYLNFALDPVERHQSQGREYIERHQSQGQDYSDRNQSQGREYIERHQSQGREYIDRHQSQGRDYSDRNQSQGREYIERNQSQGREYIEHENACKDADFNRAGNTVGDVKYFDPRMNMYTPDNVFQDENRRQLPGTGSVFQQNLCHREDVRKVVVPTDVQQLTTSEPVFPFPDKLDWLHSDSSSSSHVAQQSDVSVSESEEDDHIVSVTCSAVNSSLPQQKMPKLDDGRADMSASFHDGGEEKIIQGGYAVNYSGDGTGDGLKLSLDSSKSESCKRVRGFNQVQSHTMCCLGIKKGISTHDKDVNIEFPQNNLKSKDSLIVSSSRECKTSHDILAKKDSCKGPTNSRQHSRGGLDDSLTGASPDVSQILEWDYEEEFGGVMPLDYQESPMASSTSTGISESQSDTHSEVSEPSGDIFEGEIPYNSEEDSDHFEIMDIEFQGFDHLPAMSGFVKHQGATVPQPGFSDLDLNENCWTRITTRTISSDSSQETLVAELIVDAPESIEDAETGDDGVKQLGQSAGGSLSQAVPKAPDDDDFNSDLIGNAEDERIEADQVYGHESKTSPNVAVTETLTVSITEEGFREGDADGGHGDSPAKPDSLGDSKSPVGKEGDFQDAKSPNKDEATQQNKSRNRRPVTMTKKRSENVDHKMPNTNVASRLADYIKAPVPVKTKEEKEKEAQKKQNKNMKNASQKHSSISEMSSSRSRLNLSRASSFDKMDDDSHRMKDEKQEPARPIIKRTPRKSKWDNIMSQIEANKDSAKPKPISEIKSSLSAYLHAPPGQPLSPEGDNITDQPPKHPRKEFKSKIKELPPPPPKIDFSKIKSKLNVPTAASAIKAMPRKEKTDNKTSRESHATLTSEAEGHNATGNIRKMSESSVSLSVHPVTEGGDSAMGSHTDLSVQGNKSDIDAQHKEGLTSKGVSGERSQKYGLDRSAQVLKSDDTDKTTKTQHENQKKVTQASPTAQSKRPRVSSSTKVSAATDSKSRTHSKTASSPAQKEIERLESLCEARTKEAIHTSMELQTTSQAFDVMAVVVNYCTNELKAFECPALAQKLEAAQKQLEDFSLQIAYLDSQKETQDKHLTELTQEKAEAAQQTKEALDGVEKEREEHVRLTSDLNDTHITMLTAQREELLAKHDDSITKLTQFYERQIDFLRQAHERQIADITNESNIEKNSLKISHLEEVQELRNKHDDQMEELHKQHRNKMEDITNRFESIKLSLNEKVDSLRKECEDLARRARNSEEALQKDADFKVQIALAPYLNLPSEIESLKSIQEMRIQEIQKLRMKIMDLEKQLEEIPIARDKVISLQQKVENLEAIINIKTEREKQLHEKCQVLMRKYDRESRANKRISMDYEQVLWRMTQSSEFGSSESLSKQQGAEETSDPCDLTASHGGSNSDVVLRVRKRSSHSISDRDRKLRSRSATLIIEKTDRSDSLSPSLSPQLKQKRLSRKCQIAENKKYERMFHSAGPEMMSQLLSEPASQQKTESTENEDATLVELTGSAQVASTCNMVGSYVRSLSGISDSGVYDSLTRSDLLNSSIASTDSEWGTSLNLLVTSDSVVGDQGSGPAAGDYHALSDVTMTDGHRVSLETSSGLTFNNAKKCGY